MKIADAWPQDNKHNNKIYISLIIVRDSMIGILLSSRGGPGRLGSPQTE
jgi:hypothetical protein